MMAQLWDSRSTRPGSIRFQIAVLLFPLLLFGCGKSPPPISGGTPLGGTAKDGTAKDGKTPTETKPGGVSTDQPQPNHPCTAQEAWVISPSPADAAGFKADSNCSFHQWAYQSFSWLMSPDPGKQGRLVFEGFADPTDLFTSDGKGPGAVAYPGHTDPARPLKLLARVAKSQTTVSIKDVFQAGPGNKALIDQNGEIVYFSNHLNDTYWNFIVDNQFYDLKTLQADKTTDFPVGAIELKASWRVAQKKQEDGQWGKWLIENAEDRFHVIETTIPTVAVNEQGQIVTSPADPVAAKMALVGMHVVGVVQQHPEFIWATFEHVDNAPDKAKTPTNDGGPTGPWSFYKPGTPLAQTNQFDVNNPLAVVNVCLVNPQGGGSSDNTTAVIEINNSVRGFQKTNASKLPQWAPNYYLGGSVWANGTKANPLDHIPLNNGAFSQTQKEGGASQAGSLNLANTTLETFTQSDNCFACHNAGAHTVTVGDQATLINAKHINLSHFVVNYQASQQVPPPKKE